MSKVARQHYVYLHRRADNGTVFYVGKGKDSPSYDHTVRAWRHDDGRTFSGTRAEIIKQFGLGDPCVSAVIRGRQKSVKGWRLI